MYQSKSLIHCHLKKGRRPGMIIQKARTKGKRFKINGYTEDLQNYDHYIGLDWHKETMTIARLSKKKSEPNVQEFRSDIGDLKEYLESLTGKIIITFEETTSSHWLYVELLDSVDRIVICNPRRNRLLEDGPKNDRIDARNLSILLKGGLLKEVYHSTDTLYKLRKLERAYTAVVKAGVRLYNQKSALYRGLGKSYQDEDPIESEPEAFILDNINSGIELYIQRKKAYESQIGKMSRKHTLLRRQCDLPGIDKIFAFKIVSKVIDAHRFPTAGHYLAYCGLVKYKKESGGKNYGKRNPQYCRILKYVYKTAAETTLRYDNPMKEYYDYLRDKGISHHNAKQAAARYIAKVSYGMMKTGEKYEPYRWRLKNK